MLKNIYITLILLSSLVIMAFSDLNSNDNYSYELDEEGLYSPIIVLELYTSQGCSSCPSADLLLQRVKKEYKDEIFALSYHVDYWNYIGWKDPFSQVKYSEKQKKYNIKFRNRSNYTPQVVVNGKEHFVGSNSSIVYDKINSYKTLKASNSVALTITSTDKKAVVFNYDIRGKIKNKVIRALLVIDERTTEVKRGENRNRTLQNSNVVVAEQSFSTEESNGSMKISIPKIVNQSDQLNLIVLIENENFDITGASKKGLER